MSKEGKGGEDGIMGMGGDGEIIFFFKQKTAYEIKECDWSSDVCSSDLQYNPKGLDWGPNTWGHAISSDLVHWRQIEHAIEDRKSVV